jgi:Zn-dependent protease with chaperone function
VGNVRIALGCLIALMVLGILVFLAVVAATYAGMALVLIIIVVAMCQAYCRYIEKEADLEAARLVDEPDLVLVALAKTVDTIRLRFATWRPLLLGIFRALPTIRWRTSCVLSRLEPGRARI